VLVISGMPAEEEYEGLNVLFQLKPLQPEYLLQCVRDLMSHPPSIPSEEVTPVLPPAAAR